MNDENRNSATVTPPQTTVPAVFKPLQGKGRAIRQLLLLAFVGALAVYIFQGSSYRSRFGTSLPNARPDARIGREVYIAEGCIHCHTQYVRPGTRDGILWGPAVDPTRVLNQQPPLIGNRRQGPDLMNIGNRRSPEWNRAHLVDPRALVPASRMPAYAHLFGRGDARGEALVAYLGSLGAETAAQRKLQIQQWQPDANARKSAPADVAALYRASCVQCHGESGAGDGPLAGAFGDASQGKLRRGHAVRTTTETARVIKFGIPGTQMPGYETLSDAEVLELARMVE